MIVTGIACGGRHLFVIAQAPGESASQVYSCGLNNYGQLGHGDVNEGTAVNKDRHELTLVSAMSVKGFLSCKAVWCILTQVLFILWP
jgi:alpha-tubulin suppressor-like RCC1 family protein